MVYQWYSNYKSVLKYFVSFDIDGLLKRWKIERKKTRINNREVLIDNWNIYMSDDKIDGQQLIIFPDLWTLFNTVDEAILWVKWNIFLNSNDTQNQKDKKWRMIKNWEINNIFCTHSEIFQDRNNLKKIILIDPYKRYYENQQDPRYSVNDVVKTMVKIYWASLEIW
jgi:primosomal protein N'